MIAWILTCFLLIISVSCQNVFRISKFQFFRWKNAFEIFVLTTLKRFHIELGFGVKTYFAILLCRVSFVVIIRCDIIERKSMYSKLYLLRWCLPSSLMPNKALEIIKIIVLLTQKKSLIHEMLTSSTMEFISLLFPIFFTITLLKEEIILFLSKSPISYKNNIENILNSQQCAH
jgi:hypothetical protein